MKVPGFVTLMSQTPEKAILTVAGPLMQGPALVKILWLPLTTAFLNSKF